MSLAELAVKKRTLTYFITGLLVVAGFAAYVGLGKLEDPTFTVKTAAIVTSYPGASPEEVEQEVTEVIERKLQELHQVKWLESLSRPGSSYITVEIKGKFLSREMPQIFDEIRRKVNDVAIELPPGAQTPQVHDDVGEVFGFLLAVVGDGYSPRELEDYADDVRRELGLVTGAARVDLWGVQKEAIFVDVADTQTEQLGISLNNFYSTLSQQNEVLHAGGVELGSQRMRIEAAGAFQSPEEIEDLTFRASLSDSLSSGSLEQRDSLVRLSDFARVRRGYVDPPSTLMRYDGLPAVGLAISVEDGGNVSDLGAALDKRIAELQDTLPIGIELHKVSWQSDLVDESINSFMVSLFQAVLIVLVILWIAMGRQNAIIVGTALVMTILATFVVMKLMAIDLERMSLGALVIALGMMVDNAIVVADGAYVRIQQGMGRVQASIAAAMGPSMPLLGATVIAVSFFFPIYISTESTGEYCASLFLVVAISLLISWVVSITITPLQCAAMLERDEEAEGEAFEGKFFDSFRSVLRFAIKRRWLTLAVMLFALFGSVSLFPYVPKMFFPDSSRLQFMVDYWAPEGTRIQQVAEDLKELEELLDKDERVLSVATFIGAGPPRFYLPVEPQKPYQSYGQLIVNIRSLPELNQLVNDLNLWSKANVPQAEVRVRKYTVGPGEEFRFEARISGPGTVPLEEIRRIGEEAAAILESSPLARDVRTNWRQRVKLLVAEYLQNRGRWTDVSRSDMARALLRAYDGVTVGVYREEDHLLPIIVRAEEQERKRVSQLILSLVSNPMSTNPIPLVQLAHLYNDTEDPIIWRRDRRRTITVQAEPAINASLDELRAAVVPALEAMDLPPGYRIEWGGEFESSRDAQKALIPGVIPVLIIVALLLVALFDSYLTPLVIAAVIPFAVIGMILCLFLLRIPFGFMALLGAMSLAGMMIKNAIVLLDQVNIELEEGKSRYQAVIAAAVCRLRPVCLAAATTILGVIPLLKDVFWVSMAAAIMGGLTVGTLVTMILVPVMYCIFHRVKVEEEPTPEGKETMPQKS